MALGLRPTATDCQVVCEYAHSMGNSTGNLDEWWELFERLPYTHGGFTPHTVVIAKAAGKGVVLTRLSRSSQTGRPRPRSTFSSREVYANLELFLKARSEVPRCGQAQA